jgi:hypothetical protein
MITSWCVTSSIFRAWDRGQRPAHPDNALADHTLADNALATMTAKSRTRLRTYQ